MNKQSHPFFVPNGDSRTETAVLLVGTAREYGIDQRGIAAVRGGFRISQALADVLYDEDQQEPDQAAEAQETEPEVAPEPEETVKPPAKRTTKKASGNRAAKTGSTDKE